MTEDKLEYWPGKFGLKSFLLQRKEVFLSSQPSCLINYQPKVVTCKSSLLSFSKCRGIPKYFIGKVPATHWNISKYGCISSFFF
jgi:hypothetical protein